MKNTLLLIASILLAEMILQVACQVSPHINSIIFIYNEPQPLIVKGGPLGHTGNPLYFSHDDRGYRNEKSLKSSDIVAVGDSHTYGTSVARDEAWPFLIQKALGIKTYNMGFGGYGPSHYLLQLNDAIELSPQLVIMGLYFGNDFYDSIRLAQANSKIAAFLSAEELNIIRTLEEKSRIADEAGKFSPFRATRNKKIRKMTDDKSSIRVFLSHHSALYGLVRAVKNVVYKRAFGQTTFMSSDFEVAKASLTKEQLEYISVFDGQDGWRTIFTSPYRGIANNREDPRINTGFNLTLKVLAPIKRQVLDSGAKLLVVLIPTKESVFSRKVRNPDSHIGYSDLIHSEQSNREELKQFLVEQEIPYIDLLPYLQSSGEQPYFSNLDGHPNALGHKIISDAIIDWISDNRLYFGGGSR